MLRCCLPDVEILFSPHPFRIKSRRFMREMQLMQLASPKVTKRFLPFGKDCPPSGA